MFAFMQNARSQSSDILFNESKFKIHHLFTAFEERGSEIEGYIYKNSNYNL